MATTPTAPRTRATLTSVARHAGVSRQTVSNVLHNPAIVLDGTRTRVEAAIAELDYRPHLAARQMRTSRSQAVAVRIHASRDGVNAMVLDRFVHALCETAERVGYHLVVFTAADDADEITAYRHLDRTLNIDGYVVVGTHVGDARVAWLSEHQRPFVAFGRPWSDAVDHSWVDVDGAAGTQAATEHLLAAGHTRIAFLGWTDSAGTGDDRESGWRHGLLAAGQSDADLVVRRGEDTIADGAVLAAELATSHADVTAVVCVSDSIAIGAQRARPELAVVGFDDTATAQVLGLPSVAQPYEEAAGRCFAELHRQLSPPGEAGHAHVLLTPDFRAR